MQKWFITLLVGLTLCVGSLTVWAAASEQQPLNDADALQGVSEGKVVFDIGMSNPQTLPLYLKVIAQTHADLVRQKVKPTIVLAFHGGAVKLISTNREALPMDQHPALDEIATLIAGLQKKSGVRMEACGLATKLFGVDNATILPGVKVVGNTFVSLTGYHAQGYAAIPIY
ncbi:MAG: DsrE family protein [Magnetococcales bacterium]|nr:DsrE family protein [Magnetococcales bacterium]